jgi:hypothetical protein
MRYSNLLRHTLKALILFSNQISKSSLNHSGFSKKTQSKTKMGGNSTASMVQCVIRIRHQRPPSGVMVTVCFFMTYCTTSQQSKQQCITPIFTGCCNTTARFDFDSTIQHGHFGSGNSSHQMNLVHVAQVTNTEQLAGNL